MVPVVVSAVGSEGPELPALRPGRPAVPAPALGAASGGASRNGERVARLEGLPRDGVVSFGATVATNFSAASSHSVSSPESAMHSGMRLCPHEVQVRLVQAALGRSPPLAAPRDAQPAAVYSRAGERALDETPPADVQTPSSLFGSAT